MRNKARNLWALERAKTRYLVTGGKKVAEEIAVRLRFRILVCILLLIITLYFPFKLIRPNKELVRRAFCPFPATRNGSSRSRFSAREEEGWRSFNQNPDSSWTGGRPPEVFSVVYTF